LCTTPVVGVWTGGGALVGTVGVVGVTGVATGVVCVWV